MRAKSVWQSESLGVPHRGISLTHPSNPIVFIDIERSKALKREAEVGKENDEGPYRFLFELFADLAPTVAANFYSLCVGSSTRLVEQRPQPAGYKGTVLHDALVGQHVVGGDVMGCGGSGFFSALGERNGPLQIPAEELRALAENAPSRCSNSAGLYMQFWNHTPGDIAPKVASTFRIDTTAHSMCGVTSSDGALFGRMVHRDAEASAKASRQLMEIAKEVLHANKRAESWLLPKIVLCGEM